MLTVTENEVMWTVYIMPRQKKMERCACHVSPLFQSNGRINNRKPLRSIAG